MDLRDQLQDTLGTTYTLERELGGGGMSRVFVANEVRLNRKVVVKVLAPELMQGLSAERFEREILLAASLQQANIVPVLSAGDSAGAPYFTMPFVEGQSLRARLAHGPLSIAEATSILRDVARALAYAHERGVVHRDIKPDNVLLSRGAAMVTDFGIAKAIAASATGARGATLTQLGTALGTPAYMAPEQAAGDPNTDRRADFYAFGCMAYELLTGRPPFEAKTPQRLLAAHMSETPKPVTELRPDTPPELARLIAQCLEKEPDARPQSADALLATLDTMSTGDSSRQPALPGILIGGRAMIRRALAFYAVAFVIVAVVAKAAIVGIGLPDWVFPGSLVVMALGLPVILFTGYAQFVARRAATTSPTFTPGGTPSVSTHGTMANLALKASPHLSWRRTTLGGAYAVGAFVLLVGAFMLLRALGIGPAGSLLARGRFTAREPVIIADFAVQHTDTALGAVVSDAVRAALSQSQVISLVPPPEIAAALKRMERPANTRLDLATAREMAQRAGVKAVVDGQVTGVGTGYILTLRLVSADSGVELASFRETGDGPRGLIDAADQLARKLRAKIGESLRSVQGSPPLVQATTASLEALRLFSEAARANAIEENPQAAVQYARQAVAADSNFASAWRLLAAVLANTNGSRAEADSAIEHAYRLRDRLPDMERLQTEAFYFFQGPHQDRGRALAAYLALLARGDSTVAPVNAGEVLRTEREYARAESMNMLAIHADPHTGIAVGNALEMELDQGHVDSATKMLRAWEQRTPNAHGTGFHEIFLRYALGDTTGLRQVVDSFARSSDPAFREWGLGGQTALALLHGRLADAERAGRELSALLPATDAKRLQDAVFRATVDAWFHGPSPNVVHALDASLADTPLERLPLADRPYFDAATAYAVAGAPDKAAAIVAQYRRDVTDTSRFRLRRPSLDAALGTIALVRGDAKTAIDEFRRSDVADDGLPSRECAPCVHFALGRAFGAAGQADSTIAEYEAYIATPYWLKLTGGESTEISFGDALVLAGVHKRLGELYEATGDRQKAASHYAAFVALWKNADPELQPQVEDVRRRLARLGEAEGAKR
ncbi:MAG TPA: serine/threonine-protein kinase [Gemmatimonadaceae bacterium]|nr:serine/threonine-protein kinase [Gemmatimonadaceae bacterium]